MAVIGVTGSTGRLGGRVAARLAGSGARQRLLVRDPSRAPQLSGADVVAASYDEGAAVSRALEGVEVALMVSASESVDRVAQHLTFVDAAAAAGVQHLVYVSFLNAHPDATFTLARDHWATEQHIGRSGMSFTFLRDSLYADDMLRLAGDDGVIRGPAGDGRASVVAIDDVADVATEVLLRSAAHRDVAYSVTGPEALTLDEVAAVLTRRLGRTYRFHDETLEEAYASRAAYDAPDWLVEAWVSTYTAIAAGEMATVSTAVEHITGRPATSLDELAARIAADV
ncbi:MAG: NAD(P)H-binding protein [Frankiales bacterium]|nr:NAD(P)H-binding protein [Frankiales bacterium]